MKKILIVDDEVIIAMASAEKLNKFGYQTETVNSSEEAIERATSDDSVDLVLMDINMGTELDGPQAATHILEKRQLPIVFFTAYMDEATVRKVKGISRYGYVLKNSGTFVLLDAIETAFELFESDQKIRVANRELARKNEAISTLKKKYKLLFESASDAIFLHEIGDGKTPGCFLEVNQKAAESLGYSRKELIGMTVKAIAPEAEHKNIPGKLGKLLQSGQATFESKQIRKNGKVFPVEVSAQVIELQGRELILSLVRDITVRKEMESKLYMLSIKDSLTGLFNRSILIDKLNQEIQRSRRFGRPLSVLMLDIDKFKLINDRHGHLCGDAVLRELGQIIGEELRDFDTPIRFGGEEFCIILPETDMNSARFVGERIREKVCNQGFKTEAGEKLYITCSIGSSELEAGDDYDDLIKRADRALYQAKKNGRNRFEQRQYPRLEVSSRNIKLKTGKKTRPALLKDYSRGGVLIETKTLLLPGQCVDVELKKIVKKGKIRWVSGDGSELCYRAGIKFDKEFESSEIDRAIL